MDSISASSRGYSKLIGQGRTRPHLQERNREIGNLLPNNRRQRRTCYALFHILYPVSAAHTSIFRMDSNSTSYRKGTEHMCFSKSTHRPRVPHKAFIQGYLAHKKTPTPLGPP